MEVWADGFQREGGHYTFCSLFDLEADEELPNDTLVLGETPSNARRCLLAVGRVRKSAVQGDEDDPARA
jgi:hypothetical protein